jgi:hypothetical protein
MCQWMSVRYNGLPDEEGTYLVTLKELDRNRERKVTIWEFSWEDSVCWRWEGQVLGYSYLEPYSGK